MYLDSVLEPFQSEPTPQCTPTEEGEKAADKFAESTHLLKDQEASSNSSNLFVAIFPYDAKDFREVNLQIGDLVDLLRTSETGWWKGRLLRNSLEGWFPRSYVKVSLLSLR